MERRRRHPVREWGPAHAGDAGALARRGLAAHAVKVRRCPGRGCGRPGASCARVIGGRLQIEPCRRPGSAQPGAAGRRRRRTCVCHAAPPPAVPRLLPPCCGEGGPCRAGPAADAILAALRGRFLWCEAGRSFLAAVFPPCIRHLSRTPACPLPSGRPRGTEGNEAAWPSVMRRQRLQRNPSCRLPSPAPFGMGGALADHLPAASPSNVNAMRHQSPPGFRGGGGGGRRCQYIAQNFAAGSQCIPGRAVAPPPREAAQPLQL